MSQRLEQWQIKDFDPGTGFAPSAAWEGDAGWVAATAPGDTHRSLIEAGRLADPFFGRNEAAASWVPGREWHWRARFDAAPVSDGEHVELVFDGIDTFAAVYLNGELLGNADNMFHEWRYEVARKLRAGANELVLVFTPVTEAVKEREVPTWGWKPEKLFATRRTVMRKAQFGWGWDWGPALVTTGLWRAARLERWTNARIDDVRTTIQSLDDRRCELRVDMALEQDTKSGGFTAAVSLLDPAGRTTAETTVAIDGKAGATLVIDNPQLWWTADLGQQPLYQLKVQLQHENKTLDSRELKLGLRTISLDQSPDADEPGTNFFRFVLNGVPIFARGANWIPASSFVGIVDRTHYRHLLEQTVAANMNMVRVWGGGVYEHDAFYDVCDELGLLVWQDFMFACAPYPEQDAQFVESVRREVRYQARRLRNHPSLALWCGNNENQVLQFIADRFLKRDDTAVSGSLYYDRIIPQELTELDPVTAYWPGSPWGGPSPNSMRAGDVHNWTVWHGFPPIPDKEMVGEAGITPESVHYKRYAEDQGRFISEFGIHSSPTMALLKRWMNPEDLRLDAEGFLDRIKDSPKTKVYAMLEPVLGLPKTLEEYVDFTMLLQAEGLKFGVEHFRRRKPHCSGTLIWQLNDCWPCVSWSLLDYDGSGKASFHAITRAYAPVLASFKVEGAKVELWITNDKLNSVEGEATVDLLQLDGGTLRSDMFNYAVPANSSQPVWRGEVSELPANQALHVRSADGTFAPNRYLLAPIKDLKLTQGAKPEVGITRIGSNELEVQLSADAYLLFVGIEAPQAGTRFSDNHFDLRAGESRRIRVTNPSHALAPEDLLVSCWNSRA